MKNFSSKNIDSYFFSKLKSYGFRGLIWTEVESYIVWPFRTIPGMLGCLLRYLLYKVMFKKLDSFCVIQPNVFFVNCIRIKCGRNFVVNSNTYINAVGGVEIGDNVLLGPNVVISSGEHQYIEGRLAVTLQSIVKKKIVIRNGCWIGANAVIMAGVELAEGTIVGAGAVVTKSTDAFSVVAGVPAKKIKDRL